MQKVVSETDKASNATRPATTILLVVAGLVVSQKPLLGRDRRGVHGHDVDSAVGQGEMGGRTRL